MAELAESFFTSLGMDPLPETFWQRSLFQQPADRDVVCHASAWDVDYTGDLRIKMCIRVTEEDLVTLHHELGHDYYFHYYDHLPLLFRSGANDGFHEGIGDTLALSVTPSYLAEVGLYDRVPKSEAADINDLMKRALDAIAFLPFGMLVDQWRFAVFDGKTTPANYNSAWWQLRSKYQGVSSPLPRSEEDFDPGAKYHVAANVPYSRYFIARILQYQFHRALCRAAGHTGPLHQCSIFGKKQAGKKLIAMMQLGQSRPWPDALEALSGERTMDATAIVDYYAPLERWLHEATKGERCGW
jgi:peptidyl-dipeptidase A